MKKIIALYRSQDHGKTQTLLKLIALLSGGKITFPPGAKPLDCQTMIIYRGRRVVITTGGDDEPTLKANINFFEANQGNIFVTATRTKGVTVKTLQAFAGECGIDWQRQQDDPNKNDDMAAELKKIIDDCIS